MKRRAEMESGSLDMLLDTMCNTFGGVCFIALLVAILSVMLPKETSPENESDPDVERLVENERLARLQRRRDELERAFALQRDLLQAVETNGTVTVTEAELVSEFAAKDDAIRELRSKLEAMEEEIARLATSTEYNKDEAERLRKLAEELRSELEKAENARRRTVRTPLEREIPGIQSFDLWIRQGVVYVLDDPGQCHREVRGYGESLQHCYSVVPGRGSLVGTPYFGSPDFSSVVRKVGGMRYVRIFSDSESFDALCLLRDELLRRGLRYNWHVTDASELVFVQGTDTKVQ